MRHNHSFRSRLARRLPVSLYYPILETMEQRLPLGDVLSLPGWAVGIGMAAWLPLGEGLDAWTGRQFHGDPWAPAVALTEGLSPDSRTGQDEAWDVGWADPTVAAVLAGTGGERDAVLVATEEAGAASRARVEMLGLESVWATPWDTDLLDALTPFGDAGMVTARQSRFDEGSSESDHSGGAVDGGANVAGPHPDLHFMSEAGLPALSSGESAAGTLLATLASQVTMASLRGGPIGQGGPDADCPVGHQETMEVPSQDGGTPPGPVIKFSSCALRNGVTYTLIASGDFKVGNSSTHRADAEYHDFNNVYNGTRPYNGPRDMATDYPVDMGLAIEQVGTPVGAPLWGPYRSDHVYTILVTGQAQELKTYYRDVTDPYPNLYGDNDGSLTLTIIEGNHTAPPDIVEPPSACASCGEGEDLIEDADNLCECESADDGMSEAPIRYADGTMQMNMNDLGSGGFGKAWGHTRSWSNGRGNRPNSLNGSGMTVSQMPYVSKVSGNYVVAITSNGTNTRYFDSTDEVNYTPRNFRKDVLTRDAGTDEFTLTDSTGSRFVFYGNTPADTTLRGQLKSYTDRGQSASTTTITRATGHTITVENGRLETVTRTTNLGGITTTEWLYYDYYPFSTQYPLGNVIWKVRLERQVDVGLPQVVRKVEYTYFDGTNTGSNLGGNLGDLKTVTIKDPLDNILERSSYRYYRASDAAGYLGGLKFVVNSLSYARMEQDGLNPLTVTDAVLAPYADYMFEYVGAQRVTREIVQGRGSSDTASAQATYQFSYLTSAHPLDRNKWKTETIETLPDGNQNLVYTSGYGQVMLRVFRKTAAPQQDWIHFYKYDGAGRVILHAMPSAVTGFSRTFADLLNEQIGGNYQYLNDDDGLIEIVEYYTSGAWSGYLKETSLQRGETGTLGNGRRLPQRTISAYHVQTAGTRTVTVPDTVRVYRDPNYGNPQETRYSYTWYASSVQMESVTVRHPLVSAAQNGPGTLDEEAEYFDEFGRMEYGIDATGVATLHTYDVGTGARIQTIQDHTGLNLTTTMEVDGLGREKKRTDPNGNITYTVYLDAGHEVRVYPGWDTTSSGCSATLPCTTGPIQVTRTDYLQNYSESFTMKTTPAVSGGVPTGGEPIANVQTLSRQLTNDGGQVTDAHRYFNLTGLIYSQNPILTGAQENVHYYRTQFHFDTRGRQDKVTSPTGTITLTTFDAPGRTLTTSVGTTDANVTLVAQNEYDNGTVGDGNLTKMIRFPDEVAANQRVSRHYFDWRNRRVASKEASQTPASGEDLNLNRPVTYTELNNLGQAIAQELYDGDRIDITSVNGVPTIPAGDLDKRRARTVTDFDDQGRVFRTYVFSVDQTNGTLSTNNLKTDTWYSKRSQVLKTQPPGGLVSKTEYDAVGRVKKTFSTDGGGDTGWGDADDVLGDIVLSQSQNIFDNNGNVISTVMRERFHDATGTGELVNPGTQPKARVSYTEHYFDKINRTKLDLNVGTNNAQTWTRPAEQDVVRSNTWLVNSYSYNDAGWREFVTDPRAIQRKTLYDHAGRTQKVIEAFTDGTPTDNTNRTTEYAYNGSDQITLLTAHLVSGGFQKTEYVYQATKPTSEVYSNDLLTTVKYPDKTTGNPSTSASDQEVFTYNALGQTKTKRDRNQSTHTYSYDLVGRQTADAVTTLGPGVNGNVRRLTTAYDTAGRPYLFTSVSDPTAGIVVNEVQRDFNGLGQLVAEYQAHNGAVNTGTTPKVQYAYSFDPGAGGVNHSRLSSLVYPSTTALKTIYHRYASGLDDTISRLTALSESQVTSATCTNDAGSIEAYCYLGLGTVVKRRHNQPGVDLTYVDPSTTGDGGDQYVGLDRFGRVIDHRWEKSGSPDTDRYQYGYDRNSNRMYRYNALKTEFSELYHAGGASGEYDKLNQMTAYRRGTLNAARDNIEGSPNRTQDWAHDAQGNWNTVATDGQGTQTRGHDRQNQITSITGQSPPTYDNNGNVKFDQFGKEFTYDAWNRQVRMETAPQLIYTFDALGRRITESNGTKVLYYSSDWQVLEERNNSLPAAQFVWSPVYVDALVLRDRDTNGDGTLDERLYVQQDANWNVTGILNTTGVVQERFAYYPFGKDPQNARTVFLNPGDWSDRGSSGFAWIHLHQGGRFEEASGLYHFRNREYSPTLGRWMQQDPLGYSAGDSNLYRYTSNSPSTATDPSGLLDIIDRRMRTSGKIAELDAEIMNATPYKDGTKKAVGKVNGNPANKKTSTKFAVPEKLGLLAAESEEFKSGKVTIPKCAFKAVHALLFFEWDIKNPDATMAVDVSESQKLVTNGVEKNLPDNKAGVVVGGLSAPLVELKKGAKGATHRVVHVDMPGRTFQVMKLGKFEPPDDKFIVKGSVTLSGMVITDKIDYEFEFAYDKLKGETSVKFNGQPLK